MKVLQRGIPLYFLLLITMVAALFRPAPASAAPCDDWDLLQREVRDRTIARAEAVRKIVDLDGRLRQEYAGKVVDAPSRFPVRGYGPAAVGGTGGNGYQPRGYDFYDGNRHGGHPANDIFIRDPKENGLDASTGKPAEIVAFESGVVVGVNRSWTYPSKVRGGIYIWIYNPAHHRYSYYAHLAEAKVAPGDLVKAGDPIALLGRTGKNAWPKRSPTHLHFMCLTFDGGRMKPVNTWRELLGSGR